MKPTLSVIAIVFLGSAVHTDILMGQALSGQEATNGAFFSFIPASDLPSTTSRTTFSSEYEPSGSSWGPGADESHVFFASITNNESEQTGWRLGIGKGGQIYSFRGPFGESIPPQASFYHKEDNVSIWVDEVWQNVAVAGDKINRDTLTEEGLPASRGGDHVRSMKFFVHQAGSYRHDKELKNVLYAPPLAHSWDAGTKSYFHLTWGQQASTPSINKSGLLNYTSYRDLGEGVIEVTHVMYNFGEDTFDHTNMPWGGFRTSSLPQQWVSNVDGSPTKLPLDTSYATGVADLKDTGGYFMVSQDEDPAHYAQSIVFGQDRHFSEFEKRGLTERNSRIRYGLSSIAGRPATTFRDYTVFFVATYSDIKPGDVFYWRNYFVVGPMGQVTEMSKKLNEKTDYGYLELTDKESPTVTYYVDPSVPTKLTTKAPSSEFNAFRLNAWPQRGSLPVFLMKDIASGAHFISTDPYVNAKTTPFKNPYKPGHEKFERYENQTVYQHYLTTEYVKLLGFIMPDEENLAKVREAIGDSDFCRM